MDRWNEHSKELLNVTRDSKVKLSLGKDGVKTEECKEDIVYQGSGSDVCSGKDKIRESCGVG